MRELVLRLKCDDCGCLAHFEILNTEPLTFTTDIGGMVERAGWASHPKEGSAFSSYDRCPACVRWAAGR